MKYKSLFRMKKTVYLWRQTRSINLGDSDYDMERDGEVEEEEREGV